MTRSAKEYLSNLKDGRTIYINGEAVGDVTTHRAFRNVATSMGGLFDFANAPGNRELMTFDTGSGRANRMWQLADVLCRACRAAPGARGLGGSCTRDSWAARRTTSRPASPACTWVSTSSRPTTGPRRRSRDYYRYARDNDLYLTYVIINPQADRCKARPSSRTIPRRRRRATRRARASRSAARRCSAPEASWPTRCSSRASSRCSRATRSYAMSFAMPLNAKGLKILSRKSYEACGAVDVRQPALEPLRRERRGPLLRRRQGAVGARVRRTTTSQMARRSGTRLRRTSTRTTRPDSPDGQAALPARPRAPHRRHQRHHRVSRRCARRSASSPPKPRWSRAGARHGGRGAHHGEYFVPDRHTLYAAMVLTQQLYPKFVNTLRELAGGGMIMLPSSVDDFANPELRRAHRQDAAVAGGELGRAGEVVQARVGRRGLGVRLAPLQYEMFYAGANLVTGPRVPHLRLVRRGQARSGLLDSYSLDDASVSATKAA